MTPVRASTSRSSPTAGARPLVGTRLASALAASLVLAACATQPTPASNASPHGGTHGTALEHTPASLAAAVQHAQVVLPAPLTGGPVFAGRFDQIPATRGKAPVIVFLHGSSGLKLPAIAEWQRWLAGLGVATVAPDSFALPDRLTYESPIGKATYERIHALRAAEIDATLRALQHTPWADPQRLFLAGTSEGAVAVARYPGHAFAGRLIYSWSCEDNYFVTAPRNALEPGKPVLNVISATDPYFSRANAWLGNPAATGHCAPAMQGNPRGEVVLIPGAPHTVLNLPAARDATEAFVKRYVLP